ncbi:phosphoribosyltransferase [Thermoproteota archaeon]
MDELNFLYLTWDEVQTLIEKTADKIKKDGFNPDLLVAISRGGFNPARILSDQLDTRKLASLQITYYNALNEKKEKPEILFPLNAEIKGLRVLVVDDVSDSGNSLTAVKKYIQEKGVAEVKIATIHHKPWSNIKPDYFAEEVDKWILYPWEPRESILDLVQLLSEKGISKEDIPAKLREIGYSEHELKRHLAI